MGFLLGIDETFWHLPSFSLEDVYFPCQLQGKKRAVKTDSSLLSGAFVWYDFDGIPKVSPKECHRSEVRNTGNSIFFCVGKQHEFSRVRSLSQK